MIMQLCEKKSVQYIANMLDKPFRIVEEKVKQLARLHRLTLFQLPTFTREIKKKEKEQEWSRKQLAENTMRIKTIDMSQLISVRIDEKTIVCVKPGTDIEAIKQKYKRQKIGI